VTTKTDEQFPSSITFRHINSNYFRVIHADGAIGGFTPRGQLFFNLYSERPPLPEITVQAIENGQLGKEITEKRPPVSEGILREFEVGVVMDMNVAKALAIWLDERIKIYEELQSAATARKESEVKK
jgi:hypothetical protein